MSIEKDSLRGSVERVPAPDPTILTTEQLLRVVRQEKELFDAKLAGLASELAAAKESLTAMRADTRAAAEHAVECLKEVIEAKLNASDKAIILIQDAVNRSPTIMEVSVKTEQQFKSIDTQFKERDERLSQSALANKVAIDAALQSQKEAVSEQNKSRDIAIDKSEKATTKLLDQIGTTILVNTNSVDGKINDLKERIATIEKTALNNLVGPREAITRIEGHSKGLADGWGYVVGAIGIIFALLRYLKP